MEQIFVVEDDIKLRNEIVTLLERNGYNCTFAESFENIIDEIIKIYPDLILLDINLPVYDGFYI